MLRLEVLLTAGDCVSAGQGQGDSSASAATETEGGKCEIHFTK